MQGTGGCCTAAPDRQETVQSCVGCLPPHAFPSTLRQHTCKPSLHLAPAARHPLFMFNPKQMDSPSTVQRNPDFDSSCAECAAGIFWQVVLTLDRGWAA
eukprot:3739012-Amphidinium_carterae.1